MHYQTIVYSVTNHKLLNKKKHEHFPLIAVLKSINLFLCYHNLFYVSNRKPTCSQEEIEKILASCKKNNPPLNITGVLLYSDTKFIQLVEGEAKVIMSLYDKIKLDTRHSNPIMISYGMIQEKSFPSWHMGSKKLSNSDVDFKTDISVEDKTIFDQILSGKEESGQRVLNILKKFF